MINLYRRFLKTNFGYFILLIALLSCNISFAFQNEPDGFRNLKFGMSFKQVQKIVGKDALTEIKSNNPDPLKIGQDAVDKAYYLKLNPPMISNVKTDDTATISFFKDRLSYIEISLHGDVDKYSANELTDKFLKLEKSIKLSYGMPEVDGNARTWNGLRTQIELYCIRDNEFVKMLPKDYYEKLSEKEKERWKDHVSLSMRSEELHLEHAQWIKKAIDDKNLKNASQGW